MKRPPSYAYRTLLSWTAALLLAVILCLGAHFAWPFTWVSWILCGAITALAVVCIVLGRSEAIAMDPSEPTEWQQRRMAALCARNCGWQATRRPDRREGERRQGTQEPESLWAHELSEMTAFRRADNEQVKHFFSSTVDGFRGADVHTPQHPPRKP